MLPEHSDFENELLVNVPRSAQFTTSTQLTRLCLLTLLVFAVGLLWWLAGRDLGVLNALKTQGRMTLAHVDDKHIVHGKSDSYYLDYLFKINKTWVYGNESVDQDDYTAASLGDALPVTFLPSDPQIYRLGAITQPRIDAQQNRWRWGELVAFLVFGLLLDCMEVIFRQHLALLRNGVAVAGIVTDRSTDASKKVFSVTYLFTADGRFATATTSYSKKVDCTQPFYEQAELGQALMILYHPANPSQSIPYRMLTDVTLSDTRKTI